MDDLIITFEELSYYLFQLEYVAEGRNGSLRRGAKNTLLKFYFCVLGSLKNQDSALIERQILDFKANENFVKAISPNFLTRLERMNLMILMLAETGCSDLILGRILYDDCLIGSVLRDYGKDGFLDYISVYRKLSNSKNELVLDQMEELVMDLEIHSIYPTDVSLMNVMVRPDDLQVRLIDLDDKCTYYKRKEDRLSEIYYDTVSTQVLKMRDKVLRK